MLKYLCLASCILVANSVNSHVVFIQKHPVLPSDVNDIKVTDVSWKTHLMDFLELVDVDKVMEIIAKHSNDPEVRKLIIFLLGPEFRDLVWDFESIPEFKKAVLLLSVEGFDVSLVINELNSLLSLPPYPKSLENSKYEVTDLLEDILLALPIDQMKNLFKDKLENDAMFARFFDILKTEQFSDLIQELKRNPQFEDIKSRLAKNGIDLKKICLLVGQTFGDSVTIIC